MESLVSYQSGDESESGESSDDRASLDNKRDKESGQNADLTSEWEAFANSIGDKSPTLPAGVPPPPFPRLVSSEKNVESDASSEEHNEDDDKHKEESSSGSSKHDSSDEEDEDGSGSEDEEDDDEESGGSSVVSDDDDNKSDDRSPRKRKISDSDDVIRNRFRTPSPDDKKPKLDHEEKKPSKEREEKKDRRSSHREDRHSKDRRDSRDDKHHHSDAKRSSSHDGAKHSSSNDGAKHSSHDSKRELKKDSDKSHHHKSERRRRSRSRDGRRRRSRGDRRSRDGKRRSRDRKDSRSSNHDDKRESGRTRSRRGSRRHRDSPSRRHRKRRSRSRDRRRRSRDRHGGGGGRRRSRSKSPLVKKKTNREKMKEHLLQTQAAQGGGLEALKKHLAAGGTITDPKVLLQGTSLTTCLKTGEKITPQEAVRQQMEAMQQKAQELTGIAVPKYYNPAAVNPLKYAEQVQKRKLLWSKAKEKTEDPIHVKQTALWQATSFGQEQVDTKFRKLMGVKGEAGEQSELTEEQIRKQQELFSQLDKEYMMARMTTHTHRGMGLGVLSFNAAPQAQPQAPAAEAAPKPATNQPPGAQ